MKFEEMNPQPPVTSTRLAGTAPSLARPRASLLRHGKHRVVDAKAQDGHDPLAHARDLAK
jgi:hypothetical protein